MSKDDKPDAWMPLYIGDWDGDTGHLSCEEDGAYGRLVRHYWRMGAPADNDALLARIVRMDLRAWRKVRPVLAPFFVISGGLWTHKRVEAELVRWANKKAAATEKAKAAAEKRWGGDGKPAKPRARGNAPSIASSTPQAMLEQCPSPSSREVDAPTGQSTLSGRERDAERADGSSSLRVIEGGDQSGWLRDLELARRDYDHFAKTDPDFASEIAEFIAVATAKLGLEDAA